MEAYDLLWQQLTRAAKRRFILYNEKHEYKDFPHTSDARYKSQVITTIIKIYPLGTNHF